MKFGTDLFDSLYNKPLREAKATAPSNDSVTNNSDPTHVCSKHCKHWSHVKRDREFQEVEYFSDIDQLSLESMLLTLPQHMDTVKRIQAYYEAQTAAAKRIKRNAKLNEFKKAILKDV